MELWNTAESDREIHTRRWNYLVIAGIFVSFFAVLGWGVWINIQQEAKIAADMQRGAPASYK